MKSCQPPDPNTKKPAFKLPAGACDAHCHVFGPADRFPYHPSRAYTPQDAPREKLKALHAILGIDRAVIVQASCHGPDNAATLDAIAHSGGKYRGVAIVDETYTDGDFSRLHDRGIRGVRFNFVEHLGGAPDLGLFRRVVERIEPLGWHLVLHLDARNLLEFEGLIRSLPLPIVIDHMGRVKAADGLAQRPFRKLLEFMKNENCWIKVCGAERVSSAGAPFHDAVPFARALIEAAPERVLWGTDWPHPNITGVMPNDGDLVDLVARLTDDEVLLKKLLVDNPQRLYVFDA